MTKTPGANIRENFGKTNRPRGGGAQKGGWGIKTSIYRRYTNRDGTKKAIYSFGNFEPGRNLKGGEGSARRLVKVAPYNRYRPNLVST